jgi:hypothetical protein
MVEYLFRIVEGLKPMFLWGDEKCEHTHICHPLNVSRELVLKKIRKRYGTRLVLHLGV